MEPYRIEPDAWRAITVRDFQNEPIRRRNRIGRGYAILTRRIPYEMDALEMVLANRICQLNFLRDRNKTFLGRLINKLTKAQTERLELDGMIVKQLLETLGADPMPEVRLQYIYRIPHETVREWYAFAFPQGDRL